MSSQNRSNSESNSSNTKPSTAPNTVPNTYREGRNSQLTPSATDVDPGAMAGSEVGSQVAELQKQLATASKMALMGELSGAIAHEIKNPLAIIIAMAGLVRREVTRSGIQNENILNQIGKIEKSSDRIVRIVRSVLCLARNSHQDPKVPVSLHEIFEDTEIMINPYVKEHEVDFAFDIPEDLKNSDINCRPSEIVQVLLNLLKNAIEAQLEKSEKWVRVSVSQAMDAMEIRVQDRGGGVPGELALRIFEPLFTTKPLGRGTGLGLSLSRRLIENHGGTLTLEQTDSLTTFLVRIPRRNFMSGRDQRQGV